MTQNTIQKAFKDCHTCMTCDTMTDISIRGVNEDIFKEFKAKVVKKGMTIGQAVSMAMEEWVEEETEKRDILDFKPWDWGDGTENTSEIVDEILYGKNAHK